MRLATKIIFGFGSLLAIAVFLGGVAVWQMYGVQERATVLSDEVVPQVTSANAIQRNVLAAMMELRAYGLVDNEAYLTKGREGLATAEKHIAEASALADKSTTLEKTKADLAQIGAKVLAYRQLVDETVKNNAAIAEARKALDEHSAEFMKSGYGFLDSQNELLKQELGATATAPAQVASNTALAERFEKITLANKVIDLGNAAWLTCFKSQALRDPTIMATAEANFTEMKTAFESLRKITRKKENLDQLDRAERAVESYKKAMAELVDLTKALQELGKRRLAVSNEAVAKAEETANMGLEQAGSVAHDAQNSLSLASTIMLTGLAVAFVVGSALAYVITRGITKPLNRIIAGLTEGADQVNDAAGQVSTASQQLAEGASEQASSLEETSSALEEMAAMTRTNAANAKKANELANDARKAADEGDHTMTQLNEAMVGINQSSEKISKIIKVIEEIAFQTNLLALNAAVEAARAGEHGKGFAVVADEVRNLAQRCAQAARETTALIEDAVNRSERGTQVAGEVGKSLTSIVGSAVKVSDLLNGIASASDEQAQGVDQVNTAVSQMDKVTQANASGAEESASAAEELAAQAQAVKGMVNELVAMVGGSKAGQAGAPNNANRRPARKSSVAKPRKATEAHPVAHVETVQQDSDAGLSQF